MSKQEWVRVLPGTRGNEFSSNGKILIRAQNDNSFIVGKQEKRSGDEFLADMSEYGPFLKGKLPKLELLSAEEVAAREELGLEDNQNLPKNFADFVQVRAYMKVEPGEELPEHAKLALESGKSAEELISDLSKGSKKTKKGGVNEEVGAIA